MPRAKKQTVKKEEEVMNSGYEPDNVSQSAYTEKTSPATTTASSFDVDAFLDGLFPPPTQAPKPAANQYSDNPACPVCGEVMNYDEITKQDGNVWRVTSDVPQSSSSPSVL